MDKNIDSYDITDYRRLSCLGEDAQSLLRILLENIRAGIALFEIGDKVRVLYLNEAYYECVGYTKEGYTVKKDDVLSSCFQDEAAKLLADLRESTPNKETMGHKIHGYRQDGSLGWFHVKGVPVGKAASDKPIYLTVITDITDTEEKEKQLKQLKEMNAELQIQEEKYRILEATARGILFEYFPDEDKMVFSYNFENNKKHREIENYTGYLEEYPMVHSDHLPRFKAVLKACCLEAMEGDIEYLSTVSGDGYRWHTAHYKSVRGSDGKIRSVMGRIYDIHDAKLEKERMNYRAERDGLTGVYQKNIAFEKMEEFVRQAPFSKFYFIILDLDNFKMINDQFGHQYGDAIIKDVARSIWDSFHEDSIIGRFGGDEFMVLTKNVALSEVKRRLMRTQASIKFSAGVVEWVYEDKLERVFEKADRAMYKAKAAHGNGIEVSSAGR